MLDKNIEYYNKNADSFFEGTIKNTNIFIIINIDKNDVNKNN